MQKMIAWAGDEARRRGRIGRRDFGFSSRRIDGASPHLACGFALGSDRTQRETASDDFRRIALHHLRGNNNSRSVAPNTGTVINRRCPVLF